MQRTLGHLCSRMPHTIAIFIRNHTKEKCYSDIRFNFFVSVVPGRIKQSTMSSYPFDSSPSIQFFLVNFLILFLDFVHENPKTSQKSSNKLQINTTEIIQFVFIFFFLLLGFWFCYRFDLQWNKQFQCLPVHVTHNIIKVCGIIDLRHFTYAQKWSLNEKWNKNRMPLWYLFNIVRPINCGSWYFADRQESEPKQAQKKRTKRKKKRPEES